MLNHRHALQSTLAFSIVALIAHVPADAAPPSPEWNGWRGPNRDGWVADFKAPSPWPKQLKKRWQVEVGTGYGTPLVSKGRVYQHARQGEDEVLTRLDLVSGDVSWRKSYTTPFKIGGGGQKHGKGPKSSPTIAGGRVFTMSITGSLRAWSAEDGKLLWKSERDTQFDQSHPYWGTSTSPIVDGTRVIAHFGNCKNGVLVAHDVATGKEVWTHGSDGTCYSSPLLLEIGGVRQIVEWNHRVLTGVESKTGKRLWEQEFPHVGNNQNMPTPVHLAGRLVIGGENRGLHSFEPRNVSGKWTVSKNWSQDKIALDMATAIANDGLIYGMSHYKRGQLFCVDPKTGEIRWQGPGRTGDNVMFLSIPGHVVALTDTGELRFVRATGERYEQVASYRVSEHSTWAPPVLLPGGVLIKDQKSLAYWTFE